MTKQQLVVGEDFGMVDADAQMNLGAQNLRLVRDCVRPSGVWLHRSLDEKYRAVALYLLIRDK